MADSYTDGEIAGIVIGCLIGIPLVIFLILFALRMWMRGPTKGSDNTKKLDGKLVVITGKMNCVFFINICSCSLLVVLLKLKDIVHPVHLEFYI